MKVLGLEIERRTDFLAFAAFLISLGTLAYQIGTHVIRPSAKLIKPDGITIMEFTPTVRSSYLSILAPVSVVNKSNSRIPLLADRYKVRLVYGSFAASWEWHRRVSSVEYSSQKVKLVDAVAVTPIIIDTKKIDGSFFLFTPHSRPCKDGQSDEACEIANGFVTLAQFSKIIRQNLKADNNIGSLEVSVEFDGHPTRKEICKFDFGPVEYVTLIKNSYVQVLCR